MGKINVYDKILTENQVR